MTTNENDPVNRVVTAIELNANGVISGLMNLNGDIDLGYVPLSIDPINDPIDDDNSDGVKDTPLRVTLTSTSTKVTARSVSYDPMDSDNDGIPNVYEDDDSDSVSNHYDSDYLTSRPADDRDGDGVNDTYDRDDDNDGLTDDRDDDDDNDGIKDSDDDDHDDSHETTTTTTTTGPVQNYSVVNGRLLVSQCAQCHGTNGRSVTSWDSIAGEGNELASEMFDDEPIMTAQAHGYSSAEISAMASWLGGLSNVSGVDSDGDDD
jgi:cytochrome c553